MEETAAGGCIFLLGGKLEGLYVIAQASECNIRWDKGK